MFRVLCQAGFVLNAEVTGIENVTVAALREWRGWRGGTRLILFQVLHRDAEDPWILCSLFIFLPQHSLCAVCALHPGEERKRKGSCLGDPISNCLSLCDGPGVIKRIARNTGWGRWTKAFHSRAIDVAP